MRFESGIAVLGPFLDAVLAVGERISRLAEPHDYEYYPVREDDLDAGAVTSRFRSRTSDTEDGAE